MAFVLMVRLQAAPGNEEKVAGLVKELAAASREEPGVEDYVPCRDPENPASFVIYERYRDKAAFEEHGKTEHFERIAVEQLFPSLESRERLIYETL